MPKPEEHTKFDLIPDLSIEAMANRFELGRKNYKKEAWNAFANQEKLDDKEWVLDRLRHGMDHLDHFKYVLMGWQEDDGDDDGAAIMWLGSMMHESWLRKRRKAQQDADGITG